MSPIRKKAVFFYLLFIGISIGFLVIYSMLNCFFIIRLNISMDDLLINGILPFILAWIVMRIWFYPIIKKLSGDDIFLRRLFCFFIMLTFAVPTALFQYYLSAALGELTHLDNIKQIKDHKITRYYTLKNYFIDTTNYGVSSFKRVERRKYGGDFTTIYFYVVFPIFVNKAESIHSNPLAWLAKRYYFYVTAYASNEQIARSFQERLNQFKEDRISINEFIYLEQEDTFQDFSSYQLAAHTSFKYHANDKFIFHAVNRAFDKKTWGEFFMYSFILVMIYGIWLPIFNLFDEKLARIVNFKRRPSINQSVVKINENHTKPDGS